MENEIEELKKRVESIENFLNLYQKASWEFFKCQHEWKDQDGTTSTLQKCVKCGAVRFPPFNGTTTIA